MRACILSCDAVNSSDRGVRFKVRDRRRRLVACFRDENRVVFRDLDASEEREIALTRPVGCASTHNHVVVLTEESLLYLLTRDGTCARLIANFSYSTCAAFHPSTPTLLAIGCTDGSVRMLDTRSQFELASFKAHSGGITKIRFDQDGRLYLTSEDKTASIITLSSQYQFLSHVQLICHAETATDILVLPSSNLCVTCSEDTTIKVWDSQTGACLHSFYQHSDAVCALALHISGTFFASASYDQTVVVWSSETFEVLQRVRFPFGIESIILDANDVMYVGVHNHGVMSCNARTGGASRMVIPGTGAIYSLALGMLTRFA